MEAGGEESRAHRSDRSKRYLGAVSLLQQGANANASQETQRNPRSATAMDGLCACESLPCRLDLPLYGGCWNRFHLLQTDTTCITIFVRRIWRWCPPVGAWSRNGEPEHGFEHKATPCSGGMFRKNGTIRLLVRHSALSMRAITLEASAHGSRVEWTGKGGADARGLGRDLNIR